ncbi:Polyadenylate-binding protein RBP47C [Platanthera zijinensis]|uniref:Polyadenylate-binding protein RBP47C n=1 Tax=Platanthera zijinensis TaxID=2320716 RepID=A0AAP0GE99_9ASPA
MPPRKKKTVKTVRKPKSSTPSTHAVAASSEEYDPNLTQLEPPIASVSNEATVENELQPEPEPEIEPEAKPSRIPETAAEESTMDAPVDSNPALGESPESTGVQPTEPTSVEPPANSGKKTIIRVKKVLRKKIVKKLVPKGSISAKKLDAEPLQNSNLSLKECTSKDFNPSSALDVIIQQDSMKITNDCFESSKSDDNVEIEEECGQAEAKYDTVESEKEGDQLESAMPEEAGLSERMKRRRTEIFVGGLDRDAKEEDLRSVFGKVGEIFEVRMMMDGQTGKNKGYAFLRYVEPSQAKRAVSEFTKVEVCGKVCGAAAVQGNDTIFLGNIDKKWKKEDLIKLLTELEIENIDTVTVMMDPNKTDSNRGFAFIELETNRDAQRAYKKLQKKDVLGKGRNIKVAWADSFNIPDEEEMQKVKSVYAEGVPDSWDEDKLMESFKKFGEIEGIVLGKNIKSAKRRDIAFINYKTRKAAISCIKSFSSEELTDNGSKVNLTVALAKRIQKVNQNKGGQKSTISNPLKEKLTPVQRLASQDYSPALVGVKRAFSTLGNDMIYSDLRGLPRTRLDNNFGVPGPSYPMMPHSVVGSSLLHYPHQPLPASYSAGAFYQTRSHAGTYQARLGVQPYTSSSLYHRYQM